MAVSYRVVFVSYHIVIVNIPLNFWASGQPKKKNNSVLDAFNTQNVQTKVTVPLFAKFVCRISADKTHFPHSEFFDMDLIHGVKKSLT